MVQILDEGLQMIFDELNRQDILDNTLIIFLSDNGAEATAAAKYPGANGFYRGHKGQLYEGGIRVPAIFYYPKMMKHKRTDELMLSMDLMPTILEFCGVENIRKIDGVSLLPTIMENKQMPERDIFWANNNAIAMQCGDWKIVWTKTGGGFRNPNAEPKYTLELFNMMIDPKEEHDLSATYPEKAEELQSAAVDWWENTTKGTRLEDIGPLEYQMVIPDEILEKYRSKSLNQKEEQ